MGTPAHRGKQMSEAEFKKLYYDKSIPCKQIGHMLGISEQAVRFRALKRGLVMRGDDGRDSPYHRMLAKADLFKELWLRGASRNSMIDYFGVNDWSITKAQRRLKLAPRKISRHYIKSVGAVLMEIEAEKMRKLHKEYYR